VSEEVERLYERARALEPGTRAAFVEEACRGDPRLHEELTSLLEKAEAAEEFFDCLGGAVFSAPFSTDREKGGGGIRDQASIDPTPPFPHFELPIGTTIGRYRILSLMGSGGMGVVYRAYDESLNRDVALKFLPPLSTRLDDEERLLREARAAAALQHPNVCTIHEIGQTQDGRPFIAMALYEGETLKERLRQGPMPLEEAVATAVQIARGLAAAHARGIVHRDVKPGNVILGADGTARLLDFGIAQATGASLTHLGTTPGTVAYMSPEQVRGDAVDSRTDLWSLGVVLHEMLTGVRPFRGDGDRMLREAILHAAPELAAKQRSEVPAPLARVVERLLRKDPGSRYGSAAEVLADLAQALSPGAGASRPGVVTRRRAALLAGSATALVMLVGALWFPDRRGAPVPEVTAGTREPSIAVLPLVNLSAEPRDASLADGMTEELIAILARTDGLRVIASTSVFAFKERRTDIRSIADSLGVSNILEGGVQKIGSRLRVQVRLVDAGDGSTRWSETYDREFRDVFSMQDEIARAVARELDLRLMGSTETQLLRHQTRNIAAYELYLRGHDPALSRSDSGVREQVGYFKQAIEIDSTYAAAYAALALAYARLSWANNPGMPLRELHALAGDAAERAVALDDSLAEAHQALGRVRMDALDFASAETEIERAIALDPTDRRSHVVLSTMYIWKGRPAEALVEARRALANDPLSPIASAEVAHALFANRRYDEALAQLDHIAALRPPLRRAALYAGQCYAKKQMWPEAIAALRPQAETSEPVALSLLGHTLARVGQREEAGRIQADLLARWQRTNVGAFEVAVVYAGLGDFDQAFAWLDKSVDDRSLKVHIVEPTFEDLQGDPRFERLMRRLGLQNW
jgi:TolB-like protein